MCVKIHFAMQKVSDQAAKAQVLAEALPYIRRYHRRTVVVKAGGAALEAASLAELAGDIALLRMVGVRIIVVHGGGPQIEKHLRKLRMPARIVDGLRVTDAATMEVVEMVLGGTINKGIVAAIAAAGGRAVGVTGKDGGLLQAKRKRSRAANYGQVGEIAAVDTSLLDELDRHFIPVVAPLALGPGGETLNVNADAAAAAIAAAVAAKALLLLTDSPGVLDRRGQPLATLTPRAAAALIRSGTIGAGMIPKVKCALAAVAGGVESCRILDGTVAHSLLIDLLTDRGSGTMVAAAGSKK